MCITIAANIADASILSFSACFPDSIIGFIPDKNKADVKYIKYYFDLFQRVFKKISQGTAQDNLSAKKLLGLKIPAPPLPTQQKIAQILSAYDDLIENNLKRIKLLEEMAQITYEQWFVRMKFPNHETIPVDAETGLPEGWATWNLKDYISIKHGYAYKGEFFKSEETTRILLTPGNFKIGGGLKLDKVKYYDEQAENPEDYILNRHNLLVTMTDLSKMADTLGYPLLVPNTDSITYLHNQRLGKILPTKGSFFPKYFYYMLFKDERYRGFVVGSASGATVKHTSPSKILSFKLNLPSINSNIIKNYNEQMKHIFDIIDSMLQQNQHLKEARDILLPRLMTGMIDIDKVKIPHFKT